ncbi:response regulator [Grimontia sp. NTOU-MAR1]|uniref:response regulator n=1 Tax=Grimontia sp. NTOU-MAR1 TaxID=3111011 RepID=UPI002DB5FC5B|nr:response regulator [Grimontia sp. NTOU-MAR1]WRW00581.1 response regulator [Grimontia sp. NTOU-MAR1]
MTGLVKHEPLIVLVDEDLSHIDFYQQVLSESGYWLRSVATPAKLMTILQQHPVNILVINMDFPFEGGGSLTAEIAKIKQLPSCRDTQIVMTSTQFSSEQKQLAYRSGGADYVVYPITPEELFLKMGTHLTAGARKNVSSALSRSFNVLSESNIALYPMMAAALSCAQMLNQTSLSNKQALYLNSLTRSLKRTGVICDNLRDFQELSSHYLTLENTPFDLDQLLESLREYLLSEAESREVELLFNVPLDVPRSLVGDPDRLRRVLLNIIDEAMVVGEGSPLILSIRSGQMKDHCAVLEFAINQKVTDGDESFDDLEELTERLVMSKSEVDESINLLIASYLIEQMGGQVHYDYDDGEPGVYFNVELQLAKATSDKSFSVPVDLRELRVLVVDDNPSSIAVHKAIVESLGFKVDSASDVDSAFTAIVEGHLDLEMEPFDLVLLDWHMPGKKGFHLLEKIKNDLEPEKHPLVIVISAYEKRMIDKERGQGKIDGYLHKPISASVMFDTIMGVMGQNLPKTHRRVMGNKQHGSAVTVNGGGRRILVVDDMPINQQIAREVLMSNDFQVELAASGREAIVKVCPAPELYDAILMDLEMPEMNGLEATRIIRETSDKESLPIFALTAHTMERDRQRCSDAGMNEHIPKPLDADNLLQKLAVCLGLAVTSQSYCEGDTDSPTEDHEYVDVEDGIKRVMGNESLYFKLLSDFVHQARAQENKIYQQIDAGQLTEASENAHNIAGSAGNLSIVGLRRSAKQLQNTLLALEDHQPPLDHFKRDMDNAIKEIGEILLQQNQASISTELLNAESAGGETIKKKESNVDQAKLARLKVFRSQMMSQDLIAIDTYYQLMVDYCDLAPKLKPVGDKLIELDYVKALAAFNAYLKESKLDISPAEVKGASHER